MSEIAARQTSMGGPGYVHPRSDKYRDNFDDIFKDCKCADCPRGDDCECVNEGE